MYDFRKSCIIIIYIYFFIKGFSAALPQGSGWTRAGPRDEKISLCLSQYRRTKDSTLFVSNALKGGRAHDKVGGVHV